MIKSTKEERKYIMKSHFKHFLTEFLLTILQHDSIRGGKEYSLSYDHMCKYTAKVQILLKGYCGTGHSELSDEVDYGTGRFLV